MVVFLFYVLFVVNRQFQNSLCLMLDVKPLKIMIYLQVLFFLMSNKIASSTSKIICLV